MQNHANLLTRPYLRYVLDEALDKLVPAVADDGPGQPSEANEVPHHALGHLLHLQPPQGEQHVQEGVPVLAVHDVVVVSVGIVRHRHQVNLRKGETFSLPLHSRISL